MFIHRTEIELFIRLKFIACLELSIARFAFRKTFRPVSSGMAKFVPGINTVPLKLTSKWFMISRFAFILNCSLVCLCKVDSPLAKYSFVPFHRVPLNNFRNILLSKKGIMASEIDANATHWICKMAPLICTKGHMFSYPTRRKTDNLTLAAVLQQTSKKVVYFKFDHY